MTRIEITWREMRQYGIDTNRVSKIQNPQNTALQRWEAISSDGCSRLVFGEHVDDDGGCWVVGNYDRTRDGWRFADGPLAHEIEEWPAMLGEVSAWLAAN